MPSKLQKDDSEKNGRVGSPSGPKIQARSAVSPPPKTSRQYPRCEGEVADFSAPVSTSAQICEICGWHSLFDSRGFASFTGCKFFDHRAGIAGNSTALTAQWPPMQFAVRISHSVKNGRLAEQTQGSYRLFPSQARWSGFRVSDSWISEDSSRDSVPIRATSAASVSA